MNGSGNEITQKSSRGRIGKLVEMGQRQLIAGLKKIRKKMQQ